MADEGIVWDEAKLMGTGEEGKGAELVEKNPMLWGVPGYLTKEQATAYAQFKEELGKRGDDVKKTVYSFGEVEGEVWTLTRWLRARKYVLEDTVKMIEEATECHKGPRENGYYENPEEALGCQVSLYFANYPQLYSGNAKNGAPIFISKPGILNVDALECITTLDGILKFHWYVEMHDFGNLLRREKEKNPDFKLFQCFSILDVEGLSLRQLSKRVYSIIQQQSSIDSLCFPETMSRMFIINVPGFFSTVWSVIKGYLDPRTQSKIEVIGPKSKWLPKILELIDEDQLPSDYGGKGPDTRETLRKEIPGDAKQLHTEMMYLRGSGSCTVEIEQGDFVEVEVWTRSTAGAGFTIVDSNDKKKVYCDKVEVKHTGPEKDDVKPSCVTLNKERISGPKSLKIKADSNAGRFSTHNYLVVFKYFDK